MRMCGNRVWDWALPRVGRVVLVTFSLTPFSLQ